MAELLACLRMMGLAWPRVCVELLDPWPILNKAGAGSPTVASGRYFYFLSIFPICPSALFRAFSCLSSLDSGGCEGWPADPPGPL